ncbi:MAG: hypothetical protein Q8R18_05420 [bacterium]|nr:hypothetical protein [bacterium]
MLNKKAQVEDNLEFVLSIIIIIIGVVALTIAKADYNSSVDEAKNALHGETELIGTDLLNLLKLPVSEEYTFGELIAHLPTNYPIIQEESLRPIIKEGIISSEMTCSTELLNIIHNYLEPVYGDDWFITVINIKNENIFRCTPRYTAQLPGEDKYYWQVYLPTVNPEEQVLVILEVFQ